MISIYWWQLAFMAVPAAWLVVLMRKWAYASGRCDGIAESGRIIAQRQNELEAYQKEVAETSAKIAQIVKRGGFALPKPEPQPERWPEDPYYVYTYTAGVHPAMTTEYPRGPIGLITRECRDGYLRYIASPGAKHGLTFSQWRTAWDEYTRLMGKPPEVA